jgi:hypothetical protein
LPSGEFKSRKVKAKPKPHAKANASAVDWNDKAEEEKCRAA